jgi:acetyl esterase/lipase
MPRPHRLRGALALGMISALLLSGGCTLPSPDRSHGPATVVGTAPGLPRTNWGAPAHDDSLRYSYPVPDGDPAQNFGQLYLPTGVHAAGSVPVVVLIHGGGWRRVASLRYMSDAARSLQSAGLAVWNIEYRRVGSGGGWPTTFLDVAAAVDHITTLGAVHPELDLRNVTFVGHSAGGQLAAWAATRATLPDGAPGAHPQVVPKAFVSISGVLDMRTSARMNNHVRLLLGGPTDQRKDVLAELNPIQRIDPAMPALLMHGTLDKVVPIGESERFADTLHAAGGHVRFIKLDRAGHAGPVTVRWGWWPVVRQHIVTLATKGFDAPTK